MPSPAADRVVGTGKRVTLHYTLSLASGKVVDTTKGKAPVEWVIGATDVLPAFEQCLLGMQAGETRRFEIPCTDAFGPSGNDGLHTIPLAEFPKHVEPKAGLVVGFELPSGEEIPGTVMEVTSTDVYVDFSHPLAGYDLIFDAEILNVQADS